MLIVYVPVFRGQTDPPQARTLQQIQDEKREKKRKRQCQVGPRPKCQAATGLHTLRANDEEEDECVSDEENETPDPSPGVLRCGSHAASRTPRAQSDCMRDARR